jgi:hypothetical protein
MLIIKNFDQVTKISFDQMPKLLENFDQLKMSSEIRSSDQSPLSHWRKKTKGSQITGHRGVCCNPCNWDGRYWMPTMVGDP